MASIERFEDIEAWQKARELAQEIYRITNQGSFARDFGLRDQIRRAAAEKRKRFDEYLEELTKGKESGKVRIVLE